MPSYAFERSFPSKSLLSVETLNPTQIKEALVMCPSCIRTRLKSPLVFFPLWGVGKDLSTRSEVFLFHF